MYPNSTHVPLGPIPAIRHLLTREEGREDHTQSLLRTICLTDKLKVVINTPFNRFLTPCCVYIFKQQRAVLFVLILLKVFASNLCALI